MAHTVKLSRGGTRVILFNCGTCNANLESPLDEAGQSFDCPNCGSPFVTPGVVELRQWRQQQENQARRRAEQERALLQVATVAEASTTDPTPSSDSAAPVVPYARPGAAKPAPLDGFVTDDETVLARLDDQLALTDTKLIKYKRNVVDLGIALPLETINYVAATRNTLLGWVVLIIGLLWFGSGFYDMGMRRVAIQPTRIAIGAVLVAVAFYLLRRKTIIFSSAGGSNLFSYFAGWFISIGQTGIHHKTTCSDAEVKRFLTRFFEARRRLTMQSRAESMSSTPNETTEDE